MKRNRKTVEKNEKTVVQFNGMRKLKRGMKRNKKTIEQ